MEFTQYRLFNGQLDWKNNELVWSHLALVPEIGSVATEQYVQMELWDD